MASYNLNLKNPKAKKETPIMLVVRYAGNIMRYYTGEKIHPSQWDKKRQSPKSEENEELDGRLSLIKSESKSLYLGYKRLKKHEPSPEDLKNLYDVEFKDRASGVPTSLIPFIEHFINETKESLKVHNKANSRSDIARAYGQTLTWLKMYKRSKNRRVDFDTIDSSFYNSFVTYLKNPKRPKDATDEELKRLRFTFKGCSDNTIGKHIKHLKRFLNEAVRRELTNKTDYKSFKVHNEPTEAIFLSESEINDIYNLDLSANELHSHIRDLFIVGCWTGLRYSDFTHIEKKNITTISGKKRIKIKTQKTGKTVVIPIHPMVEAIIKKHSSNDNSMPPAVNNVLLNRELKKICEQAGIDNKTLVKKTKGSLTYDNEVPKYKLVTAHTARRSFASNMYKRKIPVITIMAITGHKTEKAFLRYICVTPSEHADIMESFWTKEMLKIS